jgi:DNA-binding MarR family transcriptional regulator
MARQERGYLERRPDPTDRRVALIALTDRGWEQVGEALKIIAGVEQKWARRLGKRRLQQLRELLTELDAHEIA